MKLLDVIEGIDGPTAFLAVAREVEAFKLLNRSKRSVNTVRTVLRVWSDMGVLAPVTTDPEEGEILMRDGQDQTPAPRKRVEI